MQQDQQLYINDQLVDLADDPIPYTLQINDLGNLQSQQANFTKQFALNLTQRTRAIMGFPDDVNFNTGLVYTQMPAKYVVSGVEIVSNGFIEVQSIQNNIANVQLLAGNGDFLERIGYQIYDMGDSLSPASGYGQNKVWDAYNDCYWDVAHAAASQQKTDGWIFPVIDFGQFLDPLNYDFTLNVLGMRPAFFLHTAIELLVQSTGYRINTQKSCLYNNPVFANLYKKILIPCCNSPFEHGTDFQNSNNGKGPSWTASGQTVIQHARTGNVNDQAGIVNLSGFNNYAPPGDANTKYTAIFTFDLYMSGVRGSNDPAFINIFFTITNPDGSIFNVTQSNFQLDDRATPIGSNLGEKYAEYEFTGNKLQYDFETIPGQALNITYNFNHVGLNFGDTIGIVRPGATLAIELNETDVLYGQQIQCERILPDISQIDFLQDTLQGFGLILLANPNDNTITFASFKDIVKNIPIANDWSEKCINQGKEVSFQLANLTQTNYLRYQLDTSVDINLLPKYFADDQIDINDKTLNPNTAEQDLFVRPWAPSRNRPYYGGTAAEVLMIDRTVIGGGDTFSIGVTPRLLIDQKIDLRNVGAAGSNTTVSFWNGLGNEGIYNPDDPTNVRINDIISVPYFYKPDAPDLDGAANHLAWKDMPGSSSTLPGLKSVYYPEFQHILDQTKIVIRYFNLTPYDIASFDFLIPIYLRQDNCYYYCNKIDSWIKGQPCKLELIKL